MMTGRKISLKTSNLKFIRHRILCLSTVKENGRLHLKDKLLDASDEVLKDLFGKKHMASKTADIRSASEMYKLCKSIDWQAMYEILRWASTYQILAELVVLQTKLDKVDGKKRKKLKKLYDKAMTKLIDRYDIKLPGQMEMDFDVLRKFTKGKKKSKFDWDDDEDLLDWDEDDDSFDDFDDDEEDEFEKYTRSSRDRKRSSRDDDWTDEDEDDDSDEAIDKLCDKIDKLVDGFAKLSKQVTKSQTVTVPMSQTDDVVIETTKDNMGRDNTMKVLVNLTKSIDKKFNQQSDINDKMFEAIGNTNDKIDALYDMLSDDGVDEESVEEETEIKAEVTEAEVFESTSEDEGGQLYRAPKT